jgi:hypothetical protein
MGGWKKGWRGAGGGWRCGVSGGAAVTSRVAWGWAALVRPAVC